MSPLSSKTQFSNNQSCFRVWKPGETEKITLEVVPSSSSYIRCQNRQTLSRCLEMLHHSYHGHANHIYTMYMFSWSPRPTSPNIFWGNKKLIMHGVPTFFCGFGKKYLVGCNRINSSNKEKSVLPNKEHSQITLVGSMFFPTDSLNFRALRASLACLACAFS